MYYYIELIFFLIPVVAILFFVVSLCLFISGKRKNKRQPGSVEVHDMKTRKFMLIISSVILFILAIIVGGLMFLLTRSIRYM